MFDSNILYQDQTVTSDNKMGKEKYKLNINAV